MLLITIYPNVFILLVFLDCFKARKNHSLTDISLFLCSDCSRLPHAMHNFQDKCLLRVISVSYFSPLLLSVCLLLTRGAAPTQRQQKIGGKSLFQGASPEVLLGRERHPGNLEEDKELAVPVKSEQTSSKNPPSGSNSRSVIRKGSRLTLSAGDFGGPRANTFDKPATILSSISPKSRSSGVEFPNFDRNDVNSNEKFVISHAQRHFVGERLQTTSRYRTIYSLKRKSMFVTNHQLLKDNSRNTQQSLGREFPISDQNPLKDLRSSTFHLKVSPREPHQRTFDLNTNIFRKKVAGLHNEVNRRSREIARSANDSEKIRQDLLKINISPRKGDTDKLIQRKVKRRNTFKHKHSENLKSTRDKNVLDINIKENLLFKSTNETEGGKVMKTSETFNIGSKSELYFRGPKNKTDTSFYEHFSLFFQILPNTQEPTSLSGIISQRESPVSTKNGAHSNSAPSSKWSTPSRLANNVANWKKNSRKFAVPSRKLRAARGKGREPSNLFKRSITSRRKSAEGRIESSERSRVTPLRRLRYVTNKSLLDRPKSLLLKLFHDFKTYGTFKEFYILLKTLLQDEKSLRISNMQHINRLKREVIKQYPFKRDSDTSREDIPKMERANKVKHTNSYSHNDMTLNTSAKYSDGFHSNNKNLKHSLFTSNESKTGVFGVKYEINENINNSKKKNNNNKKNKKNNSNTSKSDSLGSTSEKPTSGKLRRKMDNIIHINTNNSIRIETSDSNNGKSPINNNNKSSININDLFSASNTNTTVPTSTLSPANENIRLSINGFKQFYFSDVPHSTDKIPVKSNQPHKYLSSTEEGIASFLKIVPESDPIHMVIKEPVLVDIGSKNPSPRPLSLDKVWQQFSHSTSFRLKFQSNANTDDVITAQSSSAEQKPLQRKERSVMENSTGIDDAIPNNVSESNFNEDPNDMTYVHQLLPVHYVFLMPFEQFRMFSLVKVFGALGVAFDKVCAINCSEHDLNMIYYSKSKL